MPLPHNRLTVSAGRFEWYPRLQCYVPRAIDRVARRLQCVAEDCVIDLIGRDAGCFQRCARRDRAELNRRHIFQRAHILAHRRTLATENENITSHNLMIAFPWLKISVGSETKQASKGQERGQFGAPSFRVPTSVGSFSIKKARLKSVL